MEHNGIKITRELDRHGDEIEFGKLYKQTRYSGYTHYNQLVIVVEPNHFDWQNKTDEYQAFKLLNVETGVIDEHFTCLHMLEPFDGDVVENIEKLPDDVKLKVLKILDINYEIVIKGDL